ncbi:MAG TPA: PAS domain S-box protein [Thermoanaerobaculia bacterium]
MATILVVDDHPVNRKLLAAILRPQGHELLEACDGIEALDIVQKQRPELIILDLAMPRMGGAGFLRARRQFPHVNSVPVILYTATYRNDEARALADDPAVVSVMTKPADPELLSEVVAKTLGTSPLPPPPIDRSLRTANAQLTAMVELVSDLFASRDPEQLLPLFCRAAKAIVPSTRAVVALYVPARRIYAEGGRRAENLAPLIAMAENQSKPWRIRNGAPELRDVPDVHCLLSVPIAAQTAVFGTLLLIDRSGFDSYSTDDERVASTLATQLALVYENLAIHRQLEKSFEDRGEELRQSREELSGIFEAAPAAIIAFDDEKHVRAWNRAAESMFGWRSFEVVGKPSPAVPAEKRAEFDDLVERCMRGEILHNVETTRVRRDGTRLDVSLSASPLRDATGRPRGKIAVLTDITERKAAERAVLDSREELRALSHRLLFLEEEERTRVARELHDQLGQLLTALKIEAARLPKGSQKKFVPLLDKTMDAVSNIVRDLRPSDIDQLGLAGAIEKATRVFQERSGVECDLSIRPSDLEVDAPRAVALYRIFEEALTNIARHAEATRVDIRLRQQSGEIVLEVRDDGRGITTEQLEAADSFGLIGMRERVEAFSGRLQIQTTGKGSIVTAALPVAKP